ncbi:HNH endonuclease [Pseudarthrobacter sp. C1]|uniref:HNH endonuclease n=1 Tax=Pseudarthrobacter sp. C1 TaxID=3108940 RepID=UPI002B051DB7|nr:HNH endonuclease [Pseudarthrobacter sp. C1]MEA3549236.1 HNH endonuclease [Pseudarthrobacter sp. C1]
MNAWLILAAGDQRVHGGNGGYDDLPAQHYSWDSTVPRHALPKVGDIVVLWNKFVLLGASRIDSIDIEQRTNVYFHCPGCAGQTFKARSTKSPRWRCHTCFHEFDKPDETYKEVTAYRSNHAAAWIDLQGLLPGGALRAACVNPKEQLSLRYLDWELFVDALDQTSLGTGIRQLERGLAPTELELPGGFSEAIVRARVGQAGFRAKLMAMYGENCAISGPNAHAGLEAAHLVSYSKHGLHDFNAGLLLRRDLHSLFDRKLLSVNPKSWRVEFSIHLMHVPGYVALHGTELLVPRKAKITGILALHYDEFRRSVE